MNQPPSGYGGQQQPYQQQPYGQQPQQPPQPPPYQQQQQHQYQQPPPYGQQQPPYGQQQPPYQQQPGPPGPPPQPGQPGQPAWGQPQQQQGYNQYPGQYQQQFHQAHLGLDDSDAGSDVFGGILLVIAGLAGVLQTFVFTWFIDRSGWQVFDTVGFGFSEAALLGTAPVVGLGAGVLMLLLSIGCFARMRSRIVIAIPGLLAALAVLGLGGYILFKSNFEFEFFGVAFFVFIASGLLGLLGSIKALATR
jgi:hypothetical protein